MSCHQNANDTPAGSLHNPDAPDGVCSASDAADAISTGYLNDQGSWTQHDRGTEGDGKPRAAKAVILYRSECGLIPALS